jgi:hypothetical protein
MSTMDVQGQGQVVAIFTSLTLDICHLGNALGMTRVSYRSLVIEEMLAASAVTYMENLVSPYYYTPSAFMPLFDGGLGGLGMWGGGG